MTATFSESVSSLQAIFPHLSPDVIRKVLLSQHGNMEHAAAVLVTEKVDEKTSIRALTTFELRKVLLGIDRKIADTFYAHGIDGESFVVLTSEQTRKYGVPLNPYRLATLKKQAKNALLEWEEDEGESYRHGMSHRDLDDDTDDEKDFELGNQNLVYCVTVPTMVRERMSLDSTPVGGIAPGTEVTVEEINGLRVRISEPLEGWISSQAQNGIRILLQMRQEDLDHLLAQELQNPELYSANLNQQESWYMHNEEAYENNYGENEAYDDEEQTENKGWFKGIRNYFSGKQASTFDFADDSE